MIVRFNFQAAMLVVACLPLLGDGQSSSSVSDLELDQLVTATLFRQFAIKCGIVKRLHLSELFRTKSQWNLVVAKQPDEDGSAIDGAGGRRGAVLLCFVKNKETSCSEDMFLAQIRKAKLDLNPAPGPFYEFLASDLVFSKPRRTAPLVSIKSCSLSGTNGNCDVLTYLLDYDRKADWFQVVFFNATGRNNNEVARFVEQGPLLGDEIVAYPTSDAPFRYFVEVYRRIGDAAYSTVLKYRSKTAYGDGNSLEVIDSEMPEILRRFGFWKVGDPLPIPPNMPPKCERLAMRRGVEWCEPQ